jgi:hypothetical protein
VKTRNPLEAAPSTSTTAPICGTPAEFRTYPEIDPGFTEAAVGSTSPNVSTKQPSLWSIAHHLA